MRFFLRLGMGGWASRWVLIGSVLAPQACFVIVVKSVQRVAECAAKPSNYAVVSLRLDIVPPLESSETVAVLFSGGLDSTVLQWHYLRRGIPVQPIYIRSDLTWQDAEITAARRVAGQIQDRFEHLVGELVELQMPLGDLYADHWSIRGSDVPDADTPDEAVYMPGRNPLLLVKAALWCAEKGIRTLAIGILANNPFLDATPLFFDAFEQMHQLATGFKLRIDRPFSRLTKRQVAAMGAELPLAQTFSCLSPFGSTPCGTCNKCAEWQQVMAETPQPDWITAT